MAYLAQPKRLVISLTLTHVIEGGPLLAHSVPLQHLAVAVDEQENEITYRKSLPDQCTAAVKGLAVRLRLLYAQYLAQQLYVVRERSQSFFVI